MADDKTPDAAKPDSERPAEKPAEKPADKPADKPAEKPAEKPADTTVNEKPAEKPAGKDDAAKPESKAPEKYALKVPEAGAAFVDPADLTHIETIARAANWSNDDAQAALEEHVATIAAQSERYLAETKADKTYGGDKLTESQRLAKLVIDKVRPTGHERRESFQRFLGRGGAGNHIEVVAFLADLGKMMGEDSPAFSRGTGGSSTKSAAEVLYGSTPAAS